MGILRRQRDGVAEGFTDEASVVPSAPTTITPLDIQQKEFGVSRFGGYKMRDVDVFLDQLTDVVSTLLAENERLLGSGTGTHIAIGEPELADVRRQADEMISRAREEATKIVADARVRALGVGSAPVPGLERAAIDAFLAQERAFLQGLGRLVQDHAESVKGMARTARRRPSTPPEPPAEAIPEPAPEPGSEHVATAAAAGSAARETPEPETTPQVPDAASADEPSAEAPALPERSAPPAPAREPRREPDSERTTAPPVPAPPDTIRIEDAEPAVSSRSESGDSPPREGSLRELFWGEEG